MRHTLSGCLFLLLSVNVCIVSAEELPLIFATGEWPPYTTEHREGYGFVTEVVTAACKEARITPVYHFYPWLRAEKNVSAHSVFAAFPYMITPKRKEQYLLSEPIFFGVNAFLYFDKNYPSSPPVEWEDITDLMGYSVCVIRGDSFEKEMTTVGLKVFDAASAANCIRMVKNGRVDFYIGEKGSIYDRIKELFPKELKHFRFLQPAYGEKQPNALIISKTYPGAETILVRFNEGLRVIQENGTYHAIQEKYVPSEE